MRIVMIGHSASGKSATLKCLGVNRSTNDMDLFILRQRLPVDVSSFQKMLRADNGDRLFVLSNEPKLMSDLIAARAVGELERISFLYVKRPQDTLFENLRKKNTDDAFHPQMTYETFLHWYSSFDKQYNLIANSVIEIADVGMEEMSMQILSFAENELGSSVLSGMRNSRMPLLG